MCRGFPAEIKLPSLEGRGDVSIALYRQNRPAPLIFILAGIGSNAVLWGWPVFSQLFYQEGCPYRHFALADELEFCIVGEPKRRARLTLRMTPVICMKSCKNPFRP